MAIIQEILDPLIGGPSGVRAGGVRQAFTTPRLLQFLAMGGELTPVSKGEYKRDKTNNVRLGRGKNSQFFKAPTAEDLERVSLASEERRFQSERQTFRELQNQPYYESLVGSQQDFAGRLSASLGQASQMALGGAAASGINLRDPIAQAKTLGGASLQATLAGQAAERQRGLTMLELLRGPGTAASLSQTPGIPFYQGLYGQTRGQQFQADQFNATGDNQFAGSILGLASSGLGAYAAYQGSQNQGGGGGGGGFTATPNSGAGSLGEWAFSV